MSDDNTAFDADISTGDPSLFAPLLTEDLSSLPPPFHITNPLKGPDFANREDNDFLIYLNAMTDTLADGINNDPNIDVNTSLTHTQFLRGAAQLTATIMEGIRTSFLFKDTPNFLWSLGPDELASLKVLAEATASLNKYFTDPTAQNPNRWQQCLRCLQVAHVSITEDNWWAHFATANQHAATARASILNATIRNFSREALLHVDKEHKRAWDEIVLRMVTTNPPPYDADPRILEWIDQEARHLKSDAETCALHKAEQHAQTLFEQQKAVIQARLTDDLTLLRDEADKALDVARECAHQELVNLKAEHKAQRAATIADLQDDDLRAARKDRTSRQKKCPNPLTSAT
jgi:hypothetical protein